MKRKGQMEIMGLLVIVILIAMIIFFSLSFSMRQASTQATTKTEFKDKRTLSLMGPTILEVNQKCGSRTVSMRDLTEDCLFQGGRLCGNSCDTLNKTINAILTQTLDVQGLNYSLIIYYGDLNNIEASNVAVNISKTGCTYQKRQSIEKTPIATRNFGSAILDIINC